MKRFLLAVLVLLASAGLAHGQFVDNDQWQGQIDGGIGGTFIPGSGAIGISGAAGAQVQYGNGLAAPGALAFDSQVNQQVQNDGFLSGAGGTFIGSNWSTSQNQYSGGTTSGGFYSYNNVQGQLGGAAGATFGGQVGVAGSAYIGAGQSNVAVIGLTAAGANQDQTFRGEYGQQSTSPNGGFIYQNGTQYAGTSTSVGAVLIGGAQSNAFAAQGGGTVALNNGQGTAMYGGGSAAGFAGASSSALGLAGGSASAFAGQQHNYEQFNQSADGTSQQYQTGTVGTFVSASD